MRTRMLVACLLTLLVAAAMPPAVHAATPVVADAGAQGGTALDGTVVWVSGGPGAETLIRPHPAGYRPATGAPRASAYRSIDLGRDRPRGLVLSYVRCA